MISLFRGHRLSCFASWLFVFFLKTYLVLLKAASTQPHVIGADGGFVRTPNALVILGALLTRGPAPTSPSLQMKTDGLILPYCISLYGVSGSFPPRLDQHHPIMASSPICHQPNILIMQLHQWRSSRENQTKGGLRVKVAEKPILRPGELKRAQDRREERESGFLHGGTVSVFHISALMGVLH